MILLVICDLPPPPCLPSSSQPPPDLSVDRFHSAQSMWPWANFLGSSFPPIFRRFLVSTNCSPHSHLRARYGKLNQDRILYCITPNQEYVFGIFDGHNVNGEVAAEIGALLCIPMNSL